MNDFQSVLDFSMTGHKMDGDMLEMGGSQARQAASGGTMTDKTETLRKVVTEWTSRCIKNRRKKRAYKQCSSAHSCQRVTVIVVNCDPDLQTGKRCHYCTVAPLKNTPLAGMRETACNVSQSSQAPFSDSGDCARARACRERERDMARME